MRQSKHLSLFQANALFLLAAAGLIGVQFLATWLEGYVSASLLSAGYYLLALALPVLAITARREQGWDQMRLLPLTFGRGLLIALLAGSALMFANLASMYFYVLVEALGGWVYDTAIELPTDSLGIARMFLLIAVLPGVCEELLFRGALLDAWESRGGPKAVVITTLLFAFLHGSVLGLPSELLAGAIMGLLTLRLNSLYAAMVFHTAYNGLAYGIMLYARDLPAVTGTVLEQMGGLAGLASTLPSLLLSGAMTLFLYRMSVRHSRPVAPAVLEPTPEPMDWQSLLVLFSGLASCAWPMLMDVLLVFGGRA